MFCLALDVLPWSVVARVASTKRYLAQHHRKPKERTNVANVKSSTIIRAKVLILATGHHSQHPYNVPQKQDFSKRESSAIQ
eukprot:scaffold216805_cov18-Prasinocladus_malaysianus.AAC.1